MRRYNTELATIKTEIWSSESLAELKKAVANLLEWVDGNIDSNSAFVPLDSKIEGIKDDIDGIQGKLRDLERQIP